MTTYFQHALKMRDAGATKRYHTARTLRTQSVAEHSFGVAMLIAEVEPNASAELLMAALHHDLAEVATGDIPAPAKWNHPSLKDIIARIEAEYDKEHGTSTDDLSPQELHVLKWCDMMELVLWCLEEYHMGNTYALEIVGRGMEYLLDIGAPTKIAQYIIDDLKGEHGMSIAQYEMKKAAWIAANPLATPAEYQQAMRRIAAECGV